MRTFQWERELAYPAMVQNGTKDFSVPRGLEGNKSRTAMGLRGKTLGIIVTEKQVPMDVVANKFVNEKYDFAINLDGGSSSSYVTPSKVWARPSKLRGFVAIWLRGGSGNYLSKRQYGNNYAQTKPIKSEAWIETDKTASKGVKLKVIASGLNLRAAATTSSEIRFVLKFGELVTWYGCQTKNWYYVRTASGKEGYVSKKYVRKL